MKYIVKYSQVFEMNCSRKHVIQGLQLQAMSDWRFPAVFFGLRRTWTLVCGSLR